jgi:hypothetical protein
VHVGEHSAYCMLIIIEIHMHEGLTARQEVIRCKYSMYVTDTIAYISVIPCAGPQNIYRELLSSTQAEEESGVLQRQKEI